MSMNKFMHPRNIFRVPPDYTDLAIKYEDFRKICKLEIAGHVSINMKSENTLEILTKCLLKEYFDIYIDLPRNCLVPTVPLRLNYILWIEDILQNLKIESPTITGVDIGCGASCIYSLLAAKKNKWKMIAVDANEESVKFASDNVHKNSLSSYITIRLQDDKSSIFKDVLDSTDVFEFSLCNPPFFTNTTDVTSRSEVRKSPKNVFTGIPDELCYEGGELAFVKKIIDESSLFKNNIKIFTTMIGHKINFTEIKKYLHDLQILNHTQTVFCQGNTTRWGIAWSFNNNLNLRIIPCREIN